MIVLRRTRACADASYKKVCPKCGEKKSGADFYPKSKTDPRPTCWCVECMSTYYKTKRASLEVKKVRRVESRAYTRNIKVEMVAAYGGKCSGYPSGYLCSETRVDCLQLDHVNNDGHLLRHGAGMRGGYPLYTRLKHMGWPKEDFQLLCANCNTLKEMDRRRALQQSV